MNQTKGPTEIMHLRLRPADKGWVREYANKWGIDMTQAIERLIHQEQRREQPTPARREE